jgi:hypothetical protein
MSNIELTPVSSSSGYSTSTANLVNHGLREGGTQAEYDMALRLQDLREACMDMVSQMKSEGYPVSEDHLKLMDVQMEVLAKERLTM